MFYYIDNAYTETVKFAWTIPGRVQDTYLLACTREQKKQNLSVVVCLRQDAPAAVYIIDSLCSQHLLHLTRQQVLLIILIYFGNKIYIYIYYSYSHKFNL